MSEDCDALAATVDSGAAGTVTSDPAATNTSWPGGAAVGLGAASDTPPAQLAGRYRLESVLGSGGMGVVFRAFDERLGRSVAIKVVRGGGEHARLLREARTMAQVGHPGVVPVYDVLETDRGEVYVVMELIDGGTLGGWLRREKYTWRDVVARFLSAGRALAAAHEAGVVHRDFKPENVLVARDGRVLVSDFGLACRRPDEPESAAIAIDVSRSGTVAGTPAYMAPEQFVGDPADARSDQFSFCVALWEGLFGRRPFEIDAGPREQQLERLRARVLSGECSPPPAGHAVPLTLVRALERGLAVQPENRWASLTELLATLARLSTPRRRWPYVVAAAVIASTVAVTFAWQRGTTRDNPRELPPTSLRVSSSRELVVFPSERFSGAAIAGNGTVYVADDQSLVTRSVDGSVRALKLDVPILEGVALSPDGVPYVLARPDDGEPGEQVLKILPDGRSVPGPVLPTGEPTLVLPTGEKASILGPFAVGRGDVFVLATGGDVSLFDNARRRWTFKLSEAGSIALSPDGKRVAVADHHDDQIDVFILAAEDGHSVERIAIGKADSPALTWRGSDLLLAVGSRGGYTLFELSANDGFRPRAVHTGMGTPDVLAANDRGVVMLDQQNRRRLQLGTVTSNPWSIDLPAPMQLPVKPFGVLGYLSSGELAIGTQGQNRLVARAVDEHGQVRDLDTPADCEIAGLWRDRPVCVHANAGEVTLRGGDGALLGTATGDGVSGLTCADERCFALVFHEKRARVYELIPGKPSRDLDLELEVTDHVNDLVGALARTANGSFAAVDGHQLAIADRARVGNDPFHVSRDLWMPTAVRWIDERTMLVVYMDETLTGRIAVRDIDGTEKTSVDLGMSFAFSLAVAPTPGGARFALVGSEMAMVVDELELTRD